MSSLERRHLYLPARDRSFWKADDQTALPLQYLAWGTRDFERQPIPVSRHEGWVCVLIEEGSPTMVVRKQAVRMPAGTIAVIGPECPFGWKGAASGTSRFRLWMWRTSAIGHVRPDLTSSYATRVLGRHDRKPFLLLHDLCRREVLRLSGPDASYLEGCRILFDATLARDVLAPAASPEPSNLVSLARAWIDAHLDSREPIARLCDYLDVSQSTLYRLFTAAQGTSPLAWFHEKRMEKARALLATGTLSVKEVAHTLGYRHANDLSRAYKRRFGASPTRAT
ncbi:MAG TPA: AraC family transcriptional regulator [Luteitalea sp.]|nr:AraC family transcriptional regulator [Luteitalea sp.]